MSIVRIGMSESKSYGDGYDAIFGKGGSAKKAATQTVTSATAAKKAPVKKAPVKKAPAKKKK